MSWFNTTLLAVLLALFFIRTVDAIEIDMSRRIKQKPPTPDPVSDVTVKKKPALSDFVKTIKREKVVDRQEVVILNTGKGFVPASVPLRKGVHYLVHLVNVNKDSKNVSFMLDAFDQHHSTYFGEIKSFPLDPDKEGVFEFQCPETSAEGRMVVYGPVAPPAPERSTAGE